MILNLDNTYLDFQSSDFTFNQESAQADTFLLNGTLRFSLTSFWEFFVSSTTTQYAAVDPVAVQLLVDGKPYGPVMDITSYASPYSAAFSNTAPVSAVVTFDNVKIYGVTSTPELIGFRVYVDSNYDGGMYNISLPFQNSGVIVTNKNIVSWTTQPTIDFVRESTSSDADLSNLGQLFQNGLFNGNGVPFLDIVNSFLEDGLFDSNGESLLTKIFNSNFVGAGNDFLNPLGSISTITNNTSLVNLVRVGFLGISNNLKNYLTNQNANGLDFLGPLGTQSSTTGLLSLLNVNRVGFLGLSANLKNLLSTQNSSGLDFLGPLGSVSNSSGTLSLVNLARVGFLGLNERLQIESNQVESLVSTFSNYIRNSSFSWREYNLETHELDAAQSLTGQNQFMNTAFQSIEENLGRLAYVFASDDELELRDSADPGVASFKDAFGGGAKAKDIGQMKNTFNDVEAMFDTGFSINDFFGSLNSDSSWSAWFTSTTASALDATPTVMSVRGEDTYNHQAYYDHLAEVEALRNREEGN